MIQVIDSGPGSGKTTWACQYMNEIEKTTPVIYVTLYNTECERIINSVKSRKMWMPRNKKKHIDFDRFTKEGKSFVATHSLFSDATSEIMENIKKKKYILILDEVITVLNKYVPLHCRAANSRMKNPDIYLNTLIESKFIYIDKNTNLVKWNKTVPLNPLDISLVHLKDLCDRDLLYSIKNSNSKSVVMWTFPHRIFNDCFSKIYILTHLFDYQIQKYYFDVFKIPYAKYHIACENPEKEYKDRVYYPALSANEKHEMEWRNRIKNLITFENRKQYIEKGDIRLENGKPDLTALSEKWYSRNITITRNPKNNDVTVNKTELIDKLQKALSSFYRKHGGTKVLFTCYRGKSDTFVKSLCDEKYMRYNTLLKKDEPSFFISLNMRATNRFSEYKAFAYMINRFISPVHDNFFKMMGITIDYEKIALAELIQLLLRTRLRNGETLDLFIASSRMRMILEKYLDGGNSFSEYSVDTTCYDDSSEDEIDESS